MIDGRKITANPRAWEEMLFLFDPSISEVKAKELY
jgi:hypothetical protein